MTGLPRGSDYARAGAAGAPGTPGVDARSRAAPPPERYRAAPLPRREGPRPLARTGDGSSAGPGTPQPVHERRRPQQTEFPAGRANVCRRLRRLVRRERRPAHRVPGAEAIGQKERGPTHRPLALRSGLAAGLRAPPAVSRRQLRSAADRQPRPRPDSAQRLHQAGCGPRVHRATKG